MTPIVIADLLCPLSTHQRQYGYMRQSYQKDRRMLLQAAFHLVDCAAEPHVIAAIDGLSIGA